MTARTEQVRSRLPLLALAVAVLIWGSTFVTSVTALTEWSPAALTVARFALAAAVLLPLAAGRDGFGGALVSARSAVLGATGVAGYFGLQNLGLTTTSAGTAALLQAALPVATTALAIAWLRERPTTMAAAGVGLATAGTVLVAGTDVSQGGTGTGSALILLGVLSYAAYTVLLRRGPGEDAIVTAATTCVWGLVFLVPWLAWEILSGAGRVGFGPEVIAALLHLGIPASALTVLLWSYGAARVAGSASGAFTAAIPAVGYLFAVLVGEAPTWPKTVGSVLAVAGTVLSASARKYPVVE